MFVVRCRDLQDVELELSKPSEYQKERQFCTIRASGGKYVLVRTGLSQVLYSKGEHLRVRDRCHDLRWMKRFHERIVAALESSAVFSDSMRNKRYVDVIKEDDVLYMQTICAEDVRCFTSTGASFPWRSLRTNDTVELMLYLRGVWWSPSMFGVSYTLSQVLRHDPIAIDHNLFAERIPRPLTSSYAVAASASAAAAPPPPPPPPGTINHYQEASYKAIGCIPSGAVRPSLKDIIRSKENLRITKYLS